MSRKRNGNSTIKLAIGARLQAACGSTFTLAETMSEPKPRAILPDAVNNGAVYLIKACSQLRLTYEVRLAAFMAQQSGRHLEVVMTSDYQTAPALTAFAEKHGLTIRRHKG